MPHDDDARISPAPTLWLRLRRSLRFRRAGGFDNVMRSRALLGFVIVACALVLVALHGMPSTGFRVDQVTLGLLIFASLPLLSQLVTSFKAGNVEVAFRDLSVHDQLFAFLDGIATKRQWTFFTPRPGEEYLGPAFAVLTEQLLTHSRPRFVAQLRTWLASDDQNQRWFAAEIVGYHKVEELRRAVARAPETANIDDDWETWELNCLWARSRFDESPYKSLKRFLLQSKSTANQRWALNAFAQMVDARLDPPETFADTVQDFRQAVEAADISKEERSLFIRALDDFAAPKAAAAGAGLPGHIA